MKPNTKLVTAFLIGGITLAGAFVATAIFKPNYLDKILHPSEERNDQIKKEMERREGGASPEVRPTLQPRREDEAKRDEEAPPAPPAPAPEKAREDESDRRDEAPNSEYIPRDQIVRIIDESDEAREGRVIEIRPVSDGRTVMIFYRKKTFLGIGSGEHQIEGILRRGLRNRFPDSLIRSLRVRSTGGGHVVKGGRNVNIEIVEVETMEAMR